MTLLQRTLPIVSRLCQPLQVSSPVAFLLRFLIASANSLVRSKSPRTHSELGQQMRNTDLVCATLTVYLTWRSLERAVVVLCRKSAVSDFNCGNLSAKVGDFLTRSSCCSRYSARGPIGLALYFVMVRTGMRPIERLLQPGPIVE